MICLLGLRSRIIFIFTVLLFNVAAWAQVDSLWYYERQMSEVAPLILKGNTDDVRQKANDSLVFLFTKVLQKSESFLYPFDSLTSIAKFVSDDKKIRILNWHIPKSDGTYDYSSIVLTKNQRKDKEHHVFFLVSNKEDNSEGLLYKKLHYKEWYGAHYYDIITVKPKKKTYYVLLGWDGNDDLSNKKIIDVLTLNYKNEPEFGEPIFDINNKLQYRVIFEYANMVSMSVRYSEQSKQIIFDHLSPSNPTYEGKYMFYGPDMTFDALEWNKKYWILKENIDVRNKE